MTEKSAEGPFDFFNYSVPELELLFKEQLKIPAFHARQVFQWVYKREVTDFSLMSDLPARHRDLLKEKIIFPEALIQSRQISEDGTRKYLFSLQPSGNTIESVMIKQPTRMTLCVSSQVGCGMACAFCRTGTMGFIRNLSTSEIVQQVRGVIADAKNFNDMFQNIVFMGMGEPLHNFDNVARALRILTHTLAYDMSAKRITVSTVGLVPAIDKFGEQKLPANLAISLNATTDEIREKIMPIDKRYPLAELIGAMKRFPTSKQKKITIEYVMLHGINDSEADLKRLSKMFHGIQVKVNLIPYNNNAGLGFETPSKDWVYHWHKTLEQKGLDVTIRWSKGRDISAACGQLATEDKKPVRKNTVGYTAPENSILGSVIV